MAIRHYLVTDQEFLDSWLDKRDRSRWQTDQVPSTGFVYTIDDRPIAIGFIRKVEGNFCMLDGLITDPSQPGELRHIALDKVVEALILQAKELGYVSMIATTTEEDILERSVKHGFVKNPHNLIVLSLGRH